MGKEKTEKIGRRDFLKKTGVASLAAGAATLGGVSLASAAAESEDDAIDRYWQKKQKEYEAKEKKLRKAYDAFGPPPKYIYRGTDWADDKATFYAPLQVLSYPKLVAVLCVLFGLTAVTIVVSRIELGILNIWIAILIASIKGSFVLLFFMHLKYESRLLKMTFVGTVVCLAILIGFIFWDISFR